MQLKLNFEPIETKYIDIINSMLDDLNCGRKRKEIYLAAMQLKVGNDLIIFSAENGEDHRLYNILHDNGKVPHGYCANWRSLPDIIEEIKHLYETA